MYVDSHCHLSFPPLRERLPDIRDAMARNQVERALCICTTLEEFDEVHGLAMAHDNFWASVGVHPDNEGVTEPGVEDLLQRAALPRVVAIGETGLDYYRLAGRDVGDMEWQRERFRRHIEASKRTGLPLIIHTRSASDDTLALLREQDASNGVFHCFTETDAVARAALDLGFHLSFSGIITFRNAQPLRDVVRWAPMDRLLIETDSPYLAPVPHRGKTNDPSLVVHVAEEVARLKHLTPQEVGRATTANFDRLFSHVKGSP